MTLHELFHRLYELPSCPGAWEWAQDRQADEAAYLACERGDYLLWIAARLGVTPAPLVLAACDCAERVLRFARPEDMSTLREALQVTRAYMHNEATLVQVLNAEWHVVDATAGVVGVAEWAVESVDAAAKTAALTANAAAHAAWAGSLAVPWSERTEEHQAQADIVRNYIPWSMIVPLVEGLATEEKRIR